MKVQHIFGLASFFFSFLLRLLISLFNFQIAPYVFYISPC